MTHPIPNDRRVVKMLAPGPIPDYTIWIKGVGTVEIHIENIITMDNLEAEARRMFSANGIGPFPPPEFN